MLAQLASTVTIIVSFALVYTAQIFMMWFIIHLTVACVLQADKAEKEKRLQEFNTF